MERIDSVEILMPTLQQAELWEESDGRCRMARINAFTR